MLQGKTLNLDRSEHFIRFLVTFSMGRISSYYYLSHQTMRHFADTLNASSTDEHVLRIMCDSYEFVEQPVRHNEEKYNE